MSEKRKPRTNPRAGSSDPELWDPDLDWYFGDFESLCGLQSIGTSGAGQNQLTPMTDEEKLERQTRVKNGFLLTMLGHAKADLRTVSPAAADRAAFNAMAHGIFSKGRRIWRKLSRLSYVNQLLLKRAYEERIPEAGSNWGRELMPDDQVRWLHRVYLGKGNAGPMPLPPVTPSQESPSLPWKNPECVPRHMFASLEESDEDEDEDEDEDVLDVVEFMERGMVEESVDDDD